MTVKLPRSPLGGHVGFNQRRFRSDLLEAGFWTTRRSASGLLSHCPPPVQNRQIRHASPSGHIAACVSLCRTRACKGRSAAAASSLLLSPISRICFLKRAYRGAGMGEARAESEMAPTLNSSFREVERGHCARPLWHGGLRRSAHKKCGTTGRRPTKNHNQAQELLASTHP